MTLVKCPLDESPASDESSDEMDGRDLQEDEEEERQVMSEVHLGCPPAHCGPYVSRFTVSLPLGVDVKRCGCLFEPEEEDEDEDEVSEQQGVSVDRDGDLVLARHRGVSKSSFSVTIRHSITSSIPNVGFQIWKAELLLADFLLHKMFTSSSLDGIIALELGAGTGLAGLLLAHVAKTVFLTDYGDGILDNCEKNVERNSRVLKYQGSVYVRELDWFTSWPPARIHESSGHNRRHSWTSSEVDEAQTVSILLAADVIYSENLTDVFFSTVQGLMSLGSEKKVSISLQNLVSTAFQPRLLRHCSLPMLWMAETLFTPDVDLPRISLENVLTFRKFLNTSTNMREEMTWNFGKSDTDGRRKRR